MKKLLAVTLAAALAAGFAGCGGSGNSSGTTGNAASTASGSADAGETIKVGSLAPLTGSVSVYGISTTNGIKMAVDEINANGGVMGRQIELLTEDEKGEVQDAVNGYNKLISDGMVFLIGDVTSKPCNAVAKIAAGDGTPMLTPTGTCLLYTSISYVRSSWRMCLSKAGHTALIGIFHWCGHGILCV